MSVPGPPEILPRRPAAVVDLQTDEGAALVGGVWRYADARVEEIDFVALAGVGAADPLGPGEVQNATYDIVPHAQAADYDDSDWQVLAPEETMARLADGRVCFNWYRIAVTLPHRLGDVPVAGSTVLFEVVADDYAEVWVDGVLAPALGDSGGQVVAGFNAPNRVVLTRDARPGQRFAIAVFGINGPISASPRNYIWLRSASLEFHAPRSEPSDVVATGFEALAAVVVAPDGGGLFSSRATGAVYRDAPRLAPVTVVRAKSWARALAFDEDGLLLIGRSDHTLRVNPHGDTTVLPGPLASSATGEYAITPTSLYRTRSTP